MYLFSKMMAKVKEANMKKMKKTTRSRSFLEKLKVKYFILFSLQAKVLEGTVSVIFKSPSMQRCLIHNRTL